MQSDDDTNEPKGSLSKGYAMMGLKERVETFSSTKKGRTGPETRWARGQCQSFMTTQWVLPRIHCQRRSSVRNLLLL